MARSKLFRFFPIPKYIVMPSFGLEISERTVKYVEMRETDQGLIVENYGLEHLPVGAVGKGMVLEPEKLITVLDLMRKTKNIESVRLSIPEEQVYTFQTEIEVAIGVDIRDSIMLIIEGFIPVPADTVEFDYDIVSVNGNKVTIQVAAAEQKVIDSYVEACSQAGIEVVSCEYECQALARAITKPHDSSVIYIVDIGHASTTASVVQDGLIVSASTINRGGEEVTVAVANALGIDVKTAENIKHTIGMNATGEYAKMPEVLSTAYMPLFDEIIKQYNAWLSYIHERTGLYRPIESIQIVGTEALTPGFIDLFQATFHKPVVLADVWTRIEAISTHVPKIHFDDSVIYGTAIGLALGAYEV
jgi:type IV pilus assembly protein PilM